MPGGIYEGEMPNPLGVAYGSFVRGLLQDQAQKEAQEKAEEQQRQQQKIAIANLYMKDPETASRLLAANPHLLGDDVDFNLPAQSDAEKARALAAQQGLAYYQNPHHAPGFDSASAYQMGTGAAIPKNVGDASIAQDTLGDPNVPSDMKRGVTNNLGITPTWQQQTDQDNDVRDYSTMEKPLNDAKITSEQAQAAQRNAAAGMDRSHAGLYDAQTNKVQSGGFGSGEQSPAVAAGTIRIKAALNQGIPLQDALKSISDKKTRDAVANNLLVDPDTAQYFTNPSNQKINKTTADSVAAMDPIIDSAKSLLTVLDPLKTDNTNRGALDYAKYKFGISPDDPVGGQLANMSMLKVQGGTRLLKGGSRAIQALEEAWKHQPQPLDTYQQKYEKTINFLKNMQDARRKAIEDGVPLTGNYLQQRTPSGQPNINSQGDVVDDDDDSPTSGGGADFSYIPGKGLVKH